MTKKPWERPVECYIDKKGRIWQRISEDKVWNIQVGYGGWYGGEGLRVFKAKENVNK